MKIGFKYAIYIIGCFLAFYFIAQNFAISQKALQSNNQAGQFERVKSVNVYFVDKAKAESSSCEADVVIVRQVPNAESLGLGALEALANGLLPDEQGFYYSAINKDTRIQRFEIKNGTAYVDFNSALNKDSGGSCRVIAIRSQIEKTLLDLPDIDSVVISVDGETEGILEP